MQSHSAGDFGIVLISLEAFLSSAIHYSHSTGCPRHSNWRN